MDRNCKVFEAQIGQPKSQTHQAMHAHNFGFARTLLTQYFSTAPNAGKVNKAINGQIVGGSAATLGQFPWQVVILIDSSSLCGGSLILNDWVLTAAHCALGRTNFKVHYGIIDWTTAPSTQIKDTQVKYVHESYNTNNLNNDIALLKLPSPVTLSGELLSITLFRNWVEKLSKKWGNYTFGISKAEKLQFLSSLFIFL